MILALFTAFAFAQATSEPETGTPAESPAPQDPAPTEPGEPPIEPIEPIEPSGPPTPEPAPEPPEPVPEASDAPSEQGSSPLLPRVPEPGPWPPAPPAEGAPTSVPEPPPAILAPPLPAPQGPPAIEPGPPTGETDPAASPAGGAGPVVIEAPPQRTLDPRVEAVFDQLVPSLNRRGPSALFGLALLALVGVLAAGAARSFRDRLRPVGLLPSLMVAIEILGRAIAVVFAVTILVALLPVGILPALTWIAIGAAIAVGWSLREILPDVLAWVVLATEGQLVRGVWVRIGDLHGSIDSFTLRSVWIRDVHGQRVSIPNRLLLKQPIQATTDSFPKTHLMLSLPDVDADVARRVLREATLLSPWLAPSTLPEIGQDPLDPSRWNITVRLLEGAYEAAFAGTFPERVREVLAEHSGMPLPGE